MKTALQPLVYALLSFLTENTLPKKSLCSLILFKLLVLTLLATIPETALAVEIRNRQSGSATMTASDTDITITLSQSVNMSTSILLFSYRVDGNAPQEVLVGGELSSSTTVEFHRDYTGTGGAVVEIEWQVLEFLSGITVYRGSGNVSNGTDLPIGADVAIGRSWPIISYENNGNTMGSDDMYAVELSDTDATAGYDQVSFTSEAGNATAYWQVVECAAGECQVETLTTSITNPATSATATITLNANAGVTTTQTLLFVSHTLGGNIEGDDLIRTELTDATTITYTRVDGDDIDIPTITTHVVEFLDGTTSVQHGTLSFPDASTDAVAAPTQTATITSVDLAASMVISPGNLGIQGSGGVTGDDNPGGNWFSFELTNATTITATRAETSATADASYQVAEFTYTPPDNWYTYQSGNWSDPNVWTTDPSGSLLTNPSSEIPGNNDNVFILSGDAITLDINNISIGSIRIDESIDVAATTGHNFTTISGSGRILMSGNSGTDNFPDGDVSSFADAVNGGTVEIYGTGITLDQTRTWNDLVINMTNTSDDVVQLADITLNGNLTITRGDWQINDNSATIPLDLEVLGNVLVDTDGSMRVGTANAYNNNEGGTYGDYHRGFHEMIVHGNLTNNGGIRFTNQIVPDYNDITTSGAVSLVFTGATDNTFSCNNTTDLYNLVVDKGTDQTYEIELNVATRADFALFGANDLGQVNNGADPENQKALWVKAGTLRLTGNVFIPSLTEGGRDYNIGSNARILLDGPNVEVHITADIDASGRTPTDWSTFSHGTPTGINDGSGQQSLTLYGTMQVNDGFLWTGRSIGILFRDEAPGVIEVNGGELNAVQISLSGTASAGIYTFSLNGGTIRLTDYRGGARNSESILHLDNPDVVFNMTGGELIVEGLSGNANTDGILINASAGNINVTSGTVRTNYAGTVEINSTAPFYNLVVETHTVDMQSDLQILNDLTISTGITRTNGGNTYGGYLDLCPDGTTCYNLEVGRNLTIEDSGVLDFFTDAADDAGSATLTFNGTDNGTFYIGDITTYDSSLTAYSDPDGDATYVDYRFPIYNLVVDKSGGTIQLQAKNPGVEDGAGEKTAAGGKNLDSNNARLLYISNGLTISSGSTLNQIDPAGDEFGYIVRVYAPTITIDGNLLVYEQGVNPVNSFLEVREQDAVTVGDVILINTTEGSTIGNLTVDLGNDELQLGGDLSVTRFSYRHGGVNLGTYNLRVDILDLNTENDGDSDRLRNGNGENLFGDNRSGAEQYFFTAGNASDGGLTIKIPRVSNVHGVDGLGNNDDEQNVGFDPSYGDRNHEYQNQNLLWFPIGIKDKYTPAVAYINSTGVTYTGDEYITVRPVDGELQTTDLSGGDLLSYYWNVDYEGTFNSGTLPTVSWLFQYDEADIDGGTESNYVPGKVLDGGAYTRSYDGLAEAVRHAGDSGNDGAAEAGNIMGTDPGNIIIFNGDNTDDVDPVTITADANDDIDGITGQKVFNDGGDPDLTSERVNGNWDNAFPGTGFTLENANYTAGESTRFVGAPEIYYSTTVNDGNDTNFNENDRWNETNLWSTVGHYSGTNTGTYPQAGDIAIMAFGLQNSTSTTDNSQRAHWFFLNQDLDLAELIFSEQVTNANGDIVVNDDSFQPQLIIDADNAHDINIGKVSGNGTFNVQVDCAPCNADPASSTIIIANISADFGEFAAERSARFDYDLYNNNNTAVFLPTSFPITYPNVNIKGQGGNGRSLAFQEDITINRNLTVREGGVLRLSEVTNGDVTVGNNLVMTTNARGDEVVFPDSGPGRTLRIEGDIRMDNNNDEIRVDDNNSPGDVVIHTLQVGGNIQQDIGQIDLYNGTGADRDHAVLELIGNNSATYTRTNNPVMDLYRLVVNKGVNQDSTFSFNNEFNLPQPSDIAQQPVEILNGTLIINDPAIDITLTDAARGNFLLPNTTNPGASSGSGGLEIQQGTVRVEGDDTGIILDGLLRVSGGTLDMEDATNNGNNFIQYSASGNAELEISAGTLTVGSQIRRSTSNTASVLKYRQTGGTVDIGTQGDDLSVFELNRGLFEVLNTGSEFTLTGGTFTIHNQNGSTPTVAALLLEPASSSVTGSTINLGGASTQTGQTMGINSSIPLNNLMINSTNSPTVQTQVRDLTINGDLTINTSAELDANGLGLLLGGDIVNNGTFTANSNITTFNGSSDQQISGTAAGGTTFHNLVKSNSNTLTLSSHDITVSNDLTLSEGTIDDGGNTITVQRNMVHDGTHTTSVAGGEGIVFAGSSQQQITRTTSGTSTFGKLTINNSNGVRIPDNNGYNFTIDNALRLSAGIFDIGSSLLTITADASIEEVNPFGASNMIQTNSSFTDNGVRRNFNAIGSSTPLMFPIGQTKYTPVEFDITNSDAGSITVRPANEMHPSIINDSETPEIVDADNVLQYHWIVKAADLTNFTATATMTYDQADIRTVDYNEDRYIPARLYESDTFWDKSLDSTNVDETNNIITFPFSNVTDTNITGDYTAGYPDAIPDQVPTYETTGTGGDYTASGTWNAVTAGAPAVSEGVGPVGSIIIVRDGDVLTFDQNSIRAYRTTIETGGILEVDGTFGHSLGTVSGGGDIRIISNGVSAVLPAGFYTDFFDCSGGGLEYAGTGSYSIEGGLTELRNLTLSGSGDRNLPNNTLTVCNDFTINGPTFNNPNNQNITVQNNFVQDNGTFNAGSGNLTVTNTLDINGGTFNGGTGNKTINGALDLATGTLNVGSDGIFTVLGNVTNSGTFNGGSGNAVFALAGSTAQSVSGTFTGAETFHRLQINNAAGVNFSGTGDVSTELRLTSGRLNNGANAFTLAQNAVVTPTGGSSSSYVTGSVTKSSIATGTSFRFPLGKGARYAPATVSGVMTGGQDWTAEYFTTNQRSRTSFDAGSGTETLTEIANDMWRITSSGDNEATIGITWNSGSGVTDPSDVRIVYWDNKNNPAYTTADDDAAQDRWESKGAGTSSGTAASGSVTSANPLPFSTTDVSFGQATTPLPVELTSFTAEMDGRVALLNWETASERNNDFFEVQRSINGQDWTVLDIVEGNGDSDVPLSYRYVDEQPILGVSYYRLRQVDYDGRFEYSKVISLENVNNDLDLPEAEMMLYPNPGQMGKIHLRVLNLNPYEEVELSLADTYGRVFMEQRVSARQIEDGFKLEPKRDMPAGMYVVSIKQGSTQLQKKLIIRKY